MSVSMISKPRGESAVVETLGQALAETQIVTAKAQTYHWNVTGMSFGSLHALFEEIYDDHFAAQDVLAERIKALGGHADGRLATALKSAATSECDGAVPAEKMVATMAADQRTLSATLLAAARAADEQGDLATSDLATGRAETHDKFAWMLAAHLSE
jgi:starvation-inducible DNA-binding protein